MKSISLTLTFLFLPTSIFAQDLYPDSVVWGWYCGECVGQCSSFTKIDGSGALEDNSDKLFQLDPYHPINYSFSGVQADPNVFLKYDWLLSSSIPTILTVEPTIFGEPDAYDQCGYFVSYSVGSDNYRALIDPDKVPVELEEVTKRLFE